jgi:hypothetical protein
MSQLKSSSNTPEPDRPHHDHPSASVIAQQYSSATFASSHIDTRMEKSDARVKRVIISFLKIF